MSETPTWLHGLIYDTAAYGVDGIAVLFPTVFEVAWRWIPIALTSGAEHELDYYSSPPVISSVTYSIVDMFALIWEKWDKTPTPDELFDYPFGREEGTK